MADVRGTSPVTPGQESRVLTEYFQLGQGDFLKDVIDTRYADRWRLTHAIPVGSSDYGSPTVFLLVFER